MSASHQPRTQTKDQATGPLILVVDDDKAVCDLTGTMLELNGYPALRASSGQEAVELFHSNVDRIELLVVDIVMPKMSGPIVAQELRNLRPHLPVLFISGLVSQSNFQGVMGGWFLPKPYTQKLLVTKVQQLMSDSPPRSTA